MIFEKHRLEVNGKFSHKKTYFSTKRLALRKTFTDYHNPSEAERSHKISFMQFTGLQGSARRYQNCKPTYLVVKFSTFQVDSAEKTMKTKTNGTLFQQNLS